MLSAFMTCLSLLLIKFLFLLMFLNFTQDSQEPPPVDLFIPFISPIIRMGWAGFTYYTKHRRFPIYTLRLPGIRLYVVNSTSLISAVQHHPRTLSFSPILERTASNLIGASKSGVAVLSDDEENGFIRRFHDFNHANLSTGPGLDALRTKFWRLVSLSLSHRSTISAPRHTRMYEWISHEVMMAATEAMYGAQNPFRDSAARTAWQFVTLVPFLPRTLIMVINTLLRKYQSGVTRLLTGCMPAFIAKQSLRARETLVQSLQQYYNRRGFENEAASPYIKEQYHIFSKSGLSDTDIAKTQAAFSIALMGNTIPASFWLLYHIVSNDAILQDCHQELRVALQKVWRDSGTCSLDPMSIEQSCPILLSTFKEAMRTHSMGTSITQVVEDQVIHNRYLLKKGAFVLIPAIVQHSDQSVWGENANEFDHLRFLRDTKHDRKRSKNPVGYRPFGGGWTLCPGRHVATSMILGFAASALLSFDIQPSSGQWVRPTIKKSNLSVAISQPDEDIDIELRRRN